MPCHILGVNMKIFKLEWYVNRQYFEEYFLHFDALAERFVMVENCEPIISTITVTDYNPRDKLKED